MWKIAYIINKLISYTSKKEPIEIYNKLLPSLLIPGTKGNLQIVSINS